jgi:hypothetical protein
VELAAYLYINTILHGKVPIYSLFHHLCNWEPGSLKPQFTLIHYSTTPSKCLNNSSSIN